MSQNLNLVSSGGGAPTLVVLTDPQVSNPQPASVGQLCFHVAVVSDLFFEVLGKYVAGTTSGSAPGNERWIAF